MDTLKNIKKLIALLKYSSEVTHLDVYAPEPCKDWIYYFDISGYLNGEYFDIAFMHGRGHSYRKRVAECTDCKAEINELIELHKL